MAGVDKTAMAQRVEQALSEGHPDAWNSANEVLWAHVEPLVRMDKDGFSVAAVKGALGSYIGTTAYPKLSQCFEHVRENFDQKLGEVMGGAGNVQHATVMGCWEAARALFQSWSDPSSTQYALDMVKVMQQGPQQSPLQYFNAQRPYIAKVATIGLPQHMLWRRFVEGLRGSDAAQHVLEMNKMDLGDVTESWVKDRIAIAERVYNNTLSSQGFISLAAGWANGGGSAASTENPASLFQALSGTGPGQAAAAATSSAAPFPTTPKPIFTSAAPPPRASPASQPRPAWASASQPPPGGSLYYAAPTALVSQAPHPAPYTPPPPPPPYAPSQPFYPPPAQQYSGSQHAYHAVPPPNPASGDQGWRNQRPYNGSCEHCWGPHYTADCKAKAFERDLRKWYNVRKMALYGSQPSQPRPPRQPQQRQPPAAPALAAPLPPTAPATTVAAAAASSGAAASGGIAAAVPHPGWQGRPKSFTVDINSYYNAEYEYGEGFLGTHANITLGQGEKGIAGGVKGAAAMSACAQVADGEETSVMGGPGLGAAPLPSGCLGGVGENACVSGGQEGAVDAGGSSMAPADSGKDEAEGPVAPAAAVSDARDPLPVSFETKDVRYHAFPRGPSAPGALLAELSLPEAVACSVFTGIEADELNVDATEAAYEGFTFGSCGATAAANTAGGANEAVCTAAAAATNAGEAICAAASTAITAGLANAAGGAICAAATAAVAAASSAVSELAAVPPPRLPASFSSIYASNSATLGGSSSRLAPSAASTCGSSNCGKGAAGPEPAATVGGGHVSSACSTDAGSGGGEPAAEIFMDARGSAARGPATNRKKAFSFRGLRKPPNGLVRWVWNPGAHTMRTRPGLAHHTRVALIHGMACALVR